MSNNLGIKLALQPTPAGQASFEMQQQPTTTLAPSNKCSGESTRTQITVPQCQQPSVGDAEVAGEQ